jgi:hypothetical protein
VKVIQADHDIMASAEKTARTMTYMLWDTQSANLIGSFRTVDEAFAEVCAYAREVGPEWPSAAWSLAAADEAGNLTPIAEGEVLLKRALGEIPA